jgi:formylmethanofuran dehydrogenase subunit D
MNLAQKFEGVACDKTISVTELDPNRKYRILRAKRLTTRFGPTVVLTIRDSMEAPAQVFMPRRYSDVVTDDNIEPINSNAVFLHFVYRGVC